MGALKKALSIWFLVVVAGLASFAARAQAEEQKLPRVESADKTLANGLYITGPWTAVWSSGVVAVTLAQINNDSYTRTSGSLRLELWAVVNPPARAGAFSGYRLAIGPQYDPLQTRMYYSNIAFTATFTPPPDGTYWLVLSLAEYNPSACPASDPWCTNEDSINSNNTSTFGAPPPPPSPRAALENPGPGSFQSGIGLISGWACQGPVSVSIDGRSTSIPYGGPRADTASICGGSQNGFGLLLNYNNLGPGFHTAQLYVNGTAVGSPVSFAVTVPSGEFMTGVSRTVTIADFPTPGRITTLVWQQSLQNFAIQSVVP